MKQVLNTILLFLLFNILSAQSYVDALIVKSDESVMECSIKTPFNAYKDEIQVKRSETGKSSKFASERIKYLVLLPDTDSETVLVFSKYTQFNTKGTASRPSKNASWLRLISGCEEMELYEFISSVKSSRSKLFMVYAQQGFTNYYLRRVDEKIPSMVCMNLDAFKANSTGMAGGKKYNQRILSAYFKGNSMMQEKVTSEKVSLNTLFEIVNSHCN